MLSTNVIYIHYKISMQSLKLDVMPSTFYTYYYVTCILLVRAGYCFAKIDSP